MPKAPRLSQARAEKIARGHACSHCKEYTYRRIVVKPAPQAVSEEIGAVWVATKTCGVCEYREEIGIADDGDIVYQG